MTRVEIKRLDREFREVVRKRGVCERCGTTKFLQVSHIYSRRYLSIRWHPLNVFLLCAGDHLWWHHRPADAVEWAQQKLGPTKWAILKELSTKLGKGLTVEVVKAWW